MRRKGSDVIRKTDLSWKKKDFFFINNYNLIYNPTKMSMFSFSTSFNSAWVYLHLVPISLFSSLKRRGLGRRIEGLWRQDFQVLDSRACGLHACRRDVSIYCMGLKMAGVEAGLEESFFQALNGINLESVSVRKR